jgi:hypothetical protein
MIGLARHISVVRQCVSQRFYMEAHGQAGQPGARGTPVLRQMCTHQLQLCIPADVLAVSRP